MLVGIGFIAILTAAAAERFMASRREVAEARHELHERLDEILRRLDAIEGGGPSRSVLRRDSAGPRRPRAGIAAQSRSPRTAE
jgi:hypothetical protein